MAQWYIKELSKLADISVQTLHHYDRIGLLKPSLRLSNGYRVYSENDLLKLQQIISLKFFGFELSQINRLFNTDVNMIDQLSVQSELLEKKANTMLEASITLKTIIADCSQDKPIAWETIIELIDVYRMTEKLEKTWVGKILDQEELKQYARFERDLRMRFTEAEIAKLEEDRTDIIHQIDANLDKDPTGDVGVDFAKRGMEWANHFYGKKYAGLRISIWVKGYRTDYVNQVDSKDIASQENVAWFDKAIESYYINRVLHIFNQIKTQPHETILNLWDELLTDMCGDAAFFKNEYMNTLMNDHRLNQTAKNWLKKYQRNNRSIL